MSIYDYFNVGFKQPEIPNLEKKKPSRQKIDSYELKSESRSEEDEESTSLSGFIAGDSSESEYEESGSDDSSEKVPDRYPLRFKRPQEFDSTDEPPSKKSKGDKKNVFSSVFYPVKGTDKPIIGRSQEAIQVAAMLEQPLGGIRPLLLGPRGIGKQSVIAKVAELYEKKSFSTDSKTIYCISCRELLAKYAGENSAEELIFNLKALIKHYFTSSKEPAILYLRDVESLMLNSQIADYVQTLCKEPIPIIASIAEEAKNEKIESIIKTLSQYNFSNLEIKESPLDEINNIVQLHLTSHENDQKIRYSKESVELGVKLSSKYFKFPPLPIRAINAIQECGSQLLISRSLSGDNRAVTITEKEISSFISSKTGIPQDDLFNDSVFNEKRLKAKLKEQIVGQDYAINIVAERAAMWKMGLLHSKKPWGVFLFVGPTGVGKTKLAKQLAKQLFKNDAAIIILDGSEYKESHTASNLIGAPRGYEGFDSGGMLSGPLIENPYRVVVFDEFEKAHDDVRKLFLQVFDQGRLTDRRGKIADCSKAIFLLTSNLGSSELFSDPNVAKLTHANIITILKPTLVEHLSPEMCGRFTAIIPFLPIQQKHLLKLAITKLGRIRENLLKQANIKLHWTLALVKHLKKIDVDGRFGARSFCQKVDNLVSTSIKNAINLQGTRLTGKILIDVSVSGDIFAKIIK